ncbi:NADH-quinone oxidoreductase subunit NuoG [Betaproteobacteria bacterium]|nr:NADH-quinone oxidoreductase subunit NuoG [Betaproteobacteria bacterium]
MINLKINNSDVTVKEGSTIMEAAEKSGIFVPHFCYHKKLSIAANCRMCLVEVEKSRKPLPACATPVTQGMQVYTDSKIAKEAQEGVMEFLLINHPLDCPICDQGGECQLQDLSVGYGRSNSSFKEEKRVVFHKPLGELISAEEMSRCIHCTRCVRFGEEIAGVKELGMPGRGEHSEITSYLNGAVESELSGNMIDICPVGALTSKPFRYSARSWELEKIRSVSNHDGIGANLNVQCIKNIVKRVVPFANEKVNDCWISDRDRFSYEALGSNDRLTEPMIRGSDGKLRVASWEDAVNKAKELISRSKKFNGLISSNSSMEEMALFGSMLNGLGDSNVDFRHWLNDEGFDEVIQGVPSLGVSLQDVSLLKNIFVIGSRTRDDCPLLAQKIRLGVNENGMKVWQMGTYIQDLLASEQGSFCVSPDDYLSFFESLLKFVSGDSTSIDKKEGWSFEGLVQDFKKKDSCSSNLFLLGPSILGHRQASLLIKLCSDITKQLDCKLGFLPYGGNFIGGYLSKCLPKKVGGFVKDLRENKEEVCYFLSGLDVEADFITDYAVLESLKRSRLIAFASFKSAADKYADVIFPVSSCFESGGSFINMEGRVQLTTQVVEPPGNSKELWRVLRVLSSVLGLKELDFDSLEELRQKVLPEISNDEVVKIDSLKINEGNIDFKSTLSRYDRSVQLFHFFPIYSTDAVVRRACSLQKTSQAKKPVAIFNPYDFGKAHLTDGENIKLIFSEEQKQNEVVLQAISDEKVSQGVIAVAVGSLKASNVGNAISSFQKLQG